MIALTTGNIRCVAAIGAHCDDILIGAGATLLQIAQHNPGVTVHALVLTGGGTEREVEEKNALSAFLPQADIRLAVANLPDGHLPDHWGHIKRHLAKFRRGCEPDLVLGPHRDDFHQDHRLLAELIPTEFRTHLVLGYEILEWESDLPNPALYVSIPDDVAYQKTRLLTRVLSISGAPRLVRLRGVPRVDADPRSAVSHSLRRGLRGREGGAETHRRAFTQLTRHWGSTGREITLRVLVTGTEGYLGCLLAPLLLEDGHDVVGLDTGYYKAGWLCPGPLAGSSHGVAPLTLIKDIRDVTVDDLRGIDAIVHMAELSNDPIGDLIGDVTFEINHRGSVHLADCAKRAGVSRFVYMSSCSVYGIADGTVDESSPVNPLTPYAQCKALVERDLTAMADDDFSPTFLRNATAFGASPRMRFDIVLNNLAGLAWTEHRIAMTSDGTPWRPLVHALDIAQAIRCALRADRADRALVGGQRRHRRQ